MAPYFFFALHVPKYISHRINFLQESFLLQLRLLTDIVQHAHIYSLLWVFLLYLTLIGQAHDTGINKIIIHVIQNLNKCWSHIAPFSRLYLVKLKVFVQLKSQQ